MSVAQNGLMPKIRAYLKCGDCDVPFVLRRALVVFSREGKVTRPEGGWVWMRDCQHKKAAQVVVTENE